MSSIARKPVFRILWPIKYRSTCPFVQLERCHQISAIESLGSIEVWSHQWRLWSDFMDVQTDLRFSWCTGYKTCFQMDLHGPVVKSAVSLSLGLTMLWVWALLGSQMRKTSSVYGRLGGFDGQSAWYVKYFWTGCKMLLKREKKR